VRRVAVIALAGGLLGAPALAEAQGKVDVMVVGKSRVLVPATPVTLKHRFVGIGGRRCAIGRATPLSALAGTSISFRLVDYGACSRRARDAGSLYVRQIGRERAKGRDGWVYKVGRRSGSAGAADPAGAFGRGLLRAGQRVLWFWCVKDSRDRCQRTLETSAAATATPGTPVAVNVRGYDEAGKGIPVEGATVRLGGATAVTGADGVATVTTPAEVGRHDIEASKAGLVPAFPRSVTVG
jgi:hypothetical protein